MAEAKSRTTSPLAHLALARAAMQVAEKYEDAELMAFAKASEGWAMIELPGLETPAKDRNG